MIDLKDFRLRHIADEWFLIDVSQDGKEYKPPLTLNESAAYIMDRLLEGRSVDEVADSLYDGTVEREELLKDIRDLIDTVEDRMG